MTEKKPTGRIPKLFTAIKRIWELNKNDEVHPIQGSAIINDSHTAIVEVNSPDMKLVAERFYGGYADEKEVRLLTKFLDTSTVGTKPAGPAIFSLPELISLLQIGQAAGSDLVTIDTRKDAPVLLTFNGDKDTKIEPFRAMLSPRIEDNQDEEEE